MLTMSILRPRGLILLCFQSPRIAMRIGQLVFAQIMGHLPLEAFARMVQRHRAQHKVKEFTCLDQFLALAFAQLTGRESLRDIEINLRAQARHLYRLGFRCKTISRNTLANANSTRPWAVFADLAQHLIGIARPLYADDPLGKEFKSLMGATVYALDSTTIDLCLSLFAWAPFRVTKAAIKLHTLIDLRGSIPSFIHISDGKMHDVRVLDQLSAQGLLEAGAYYVMDKAYVDFGRLYQLNTARAFFVTRAKENLQYETVRRKAVNTLTGLRRDHQIRLTGTVSCKRYPDILRRIVYFDEDTGKTFEFLTNNLTLPALTICALYKQRWQIELFFKWIKQHLRIKSFFGTSENAVKTQIWVAISTYVLIAIVKKRLHLNHSLHEILRVLNLNMFETTPIPALLRPALEPAEPHMLPIQGKLFETLGH
jgi:Transposase DDE domain/Domain of unknown function (DUF4372)